METALSNLALDMVVVVEDQEDGLCAQIVIDKQCAGGKKAPSLPRGHASRRYG